jgi:hypothetical protein
VDTHLSTLQRLQDNVLSPYTNGDFPNSTPTRDRLDPFSIPHTYDFVAEFSRQHAQIVENNENENVGNTGLCEAQNRYKKFKHGSHLYDGSRD